MTGWNPRQSLGPDYICDCQVIYDDGSTVTIRGIDPMGTEEIRRRADLVLDEKNPSCRNTAWIFLF